MQITASLSQSLWFQHLQPNTLFIPDIYSKDKNLFFTFGNNSFLSGTCSATIHLICLPDSQITHQALTHCVNRIIHLPFQNSWRNWQYPNVLSSPITQNPLLQYYENEWVILFCLCLHFHSPSCGLDNATILYNSSSLYSAHAWPTHALHTHTQVRFTLAFRMHALNR